VRHIVDRLERALDWCEPSRGAPWAASTPPRCLVISGGVASNTALRDAVQTLGRPRGLQLVCPPPSLCKDNAVMVAWAALEHVLAAQAADVCRYACAQCNRR
jgi:N6-L-threonylcarbamoyladenine synthase